KSVASLEVSDGTLTLVPVGELAVDKTGHTFSETYLDRLGNQRVHRPLIEVRLLRQYLHDDCGSLHIHELHESNQFALAIGSKKFAAFHIRMILAAHAIERFA